MTTITAFIISQMLLALGLLLLLLNARDKQRQLLDLIKGLRNRLDILQSDLVVVEARLSAERARHNRERLLAAIEADRNAKNFTPFPLPFAVSQTNIDSTLRSFNDRHVLVQ